MSLQPQIIFSRIDHRSSHYQGCECQQCTPTLRAPAARFWVYTDKGLVRLTLREGQSLTHREGGPDDEGYSYTSTTYSFDGDRIVREWHTRARDCDGPIERGGASRALLSELSVIPDEDCKHSFPLWQECGGTRWQRDAFAEAAGY